MDFRQLYDLAKENLNPRQISHFIEAGGVASAILTDKGNVYVGVCIDTACTLGMCAERNAVANMITNGENKIDKLVCVMSDGSVGSPCGACREYLMQLHKDSGEIKILTSSEKFTFIKLKELIPDWWGQSCFDEY
ncbi:MAG: cytidine deaminase [Fidelibacterota bacterium]